MGGKDRVCAGRSDEVQSDHGLGNDTIPLLGEKFGVARGEYGVKMIFECADCTFGGVAEVGERGNKLEVNVEPEEGFMHGVGALVVKDV